MKCCVSLCSPYIVVIRTLNEVFVMKPEAVEQPPNVLR